MNRNKLKRTNEQNIKSKSNRKKPYQIHYSFDVNHNFVYMCVAILDCHACMQFKVVRGSHVSFSWCVNFIRYSFHFQLKHFKCVQNEKRKQKIRTHIHIHWSTRFHREWKRFIQWPRNQWKCTIDKVREERKIDMERKWNERDKKKCLQ